VRRMDEPVGARAGTGGEAKPAGAWKKWCASTAECWNARASLWVGLIVFALGLIAQVIIIAVVGEGGFETYPEYQVARVFDVVGQALIYLGAVWVGVYLARWGLSRKKD
jgi:hypothetical protein